MDRLRPSSCLLYTAIAAAVLLLPAYAADSGTLLRTHTGRLSHSVITDLDGDRQTDFATAGASRRDGPDYVQEISFRFSAFERDTITVRTRVAGVRLIARDLDGDADRDLVLEALNREPIAVLLNDGDGHFHEADLADYFFQLSHRSPRSFASLAPELSASETGECPNDESVAARGIVSRPDLGGTRLIAWVQISRSVSLQSGAASRGPPRCC